MSDDMRGLFFIVMGQYRKGVEPSYMNRVSGEVGYIGGYDPRNENTERWYQLMDCKTFTTIACGSDLKKVVRGVYTCIMRYKGVAKRYFKHVSDTSSDDYYEVHYLHHAPLDSDRRAKKAEGRCPRTSPIMQELYKEIYSAYGDYFSDLVQEMEDKAYSELVDEKPVNKSRKILQRARKGLKPVVTPVKEDTTPPVKRPLKKVEKKEDTTPTLITPKKRSVKLLKC